MSKAQMPKNLLFEYWNLFDICCLNFAISSAPHWPGLTLSTTLFWCSDFPLTIASQQSPNSIHVALQYNGVQYLSIVQVVRLECILL